MGGKGLTYLHSCLLWLRALSPSSLNMSLRSLEHSWLLDFSESGIRIGRHSQVGSDQLLLEVDFAQRSVTRTVELSRQLAQRLTFCPVPVLQEGRNLNTGSFSHLQSLRGYYARWVLAPRAGLSRMVARHPVGEQASFLGPAGQLQSNPQSNFIPNLMAYDLVTPLGALQEGEATIPLVRWQDQGQTRCLGINTEYQAIRLPLEWQERLLECRAFFLREVPSRSPLLWIVQDGLSLNPVSLGPDFAGWSTALASQSLKTDLTGLQLVEDDQLSQMREWVQEHLVAIHLQESQRFRAKPRKK